MIIMVLRLNRDEVLHMQREVLAVSMLSSLPEVDKEITLTVLRDNVESTLQFVARTADNWGTLDRFEGRVYSTDNSVLRATLMHLHTPTTRSNHLGELTLYVST